VEVSSCQCISQGTIYGLSCFTFGVTFGCTPHSFTFTWCFRKSAEGLGYVISFAIGATLVLILMWILRFCYHYSREASLIEARNQLPSLHFRDMWLPGGLAGLLWSVGNVSSIITVESLGEGVGYSIVQAQMLIAGLWGILWYREVKGVRAILEWFLCACVTVTGIVFLSHEHVKS
jgi:Transmembrane family, TMEM144 of transporters